MNVVDMEERLGSREGGTGSIFGVHRAVGSRLFPCGANVAQSIPVVVGNDSVSSYVVRKKK